MSQNSSNIQRPVPKLDTRSFLEIWYFLPDIGKRMLRNSLAEKGLSKTVVTKWLKGGTPHLESAQILVSCLKEQFGITSNALYLFPRRDKIKALLIKYPYKESDVAPDKPRWDGKVNWKSLEDKEDDGTDN